MPLLQVAAADLGLTSLPLVLMADGDDLRVRAHTRHLVVGRSLLDEIGEGPDGDSALAAVLCHGLHHWAVGDGVGLRFVRCCGLPLVILYDAGSWLALQGNSLIAVIGWIVLWPAWLLVHLIIHPIVALGSRRQEYAADAAVRATGRGEALHRALSLLGELEPGQSGWDRVIAATHPPLELRLEALEPSA
jgi:Zn-dependent protease with chaperone function